MTSSMSNDALSAVPDSLPIELGWGIGTNTGWGLFGLHVALGLARRGRRVHLRADLCNLDGIPAPLLPSIGTMWDVGDPSERRIRIEGYGNHWPDFHPIPNRVRVLLAVFEDSAIPDRAVSNLQQYDLILSPSQWAHDVLAAKGIPSTIWHQGYDDAVFVPAPRIRPDNDRRLLVFSGGKLEFRKGQDIVVEAFKRFRQTAEGKSAILVTAWQNRWPQTMVSIYESGYVKGLPVIRDGRQDIRSWLEANGIPGEAHIDLGMPPQPQLAQAIRECDVGLFPNRCEGATNMVLPEVLGLGVPCIVSQNTGHLDVIPDLVCPLAVQAPVTLPCPLFNGFEGWGESDPDEIVEALRTFALMSAEDRQALGQSAAADVQREYGWSVQAAQLNGLLASVEELAHA